MALEPDGIPPDGGERIEQSPVARAHVEDRARRSDPVETTGEPAPERAKRPIAETRESTLGRPVPGAVGELEVRVRRDGQCRARPAGSAEPRPEASR